MKPLRWSKKEEQSCKRAIDAFWLYNRPIPPAFGYHPDTMDAFVTRFESALTEHRSEIVIRGIRSLRNTVAVRATKNREAARHFESHPNIYNDHTGEMVQRFDAFADEDDKGVAWADALIAKIEAHGLPPSVLEYRGPNG